MKTKNTKKTKTEIGLQTSPVELGERKSEPEAVAAEASRILPYVNYAERDNNRTLCTDDVLAHLKRWYPEA